MPLRQPVAGNVAAEIEEVEGDTALAQVLDHHERVEGRAEQAVGLRRDHHVPLAALGEEGAMTSASRTGRSARSPRR
jgi:hypothetical protein